MEELLRFVQRSALMVALVAGLILPSSFVQAATTKGYGALQVVATSKLSLAPGETKQVTVGFQNTGTTTWTNDGSTFVSVYTYGPKYRTSTFADPTWYKPDQPAKLTETSVPPGTVGHVTFSLHAPSTTGAYAETFNLAAEDVAWIPGGQFTVDVTVANTASTSSSATSSSLATPSPTTSTGLSAMLLLRSAKKITAAGNEVIPFTVGIKNTGTVAWNTREIHSSEVLAATGTSDTLLAVKTSDPVAPGAMDLMDFSFRAPAVKGSQMVKLTLAVDGTTVPDFEIDIPVDVTSGASDVLTAPASGQIFNDVSITDPTIRVGVMTVDDETDNQVVIGCASSWKLIDGNGGLLAELKKDETVEAFYKKQRYWFNRGKGLEKTDAYLRFVPDEANAVCTVENFDRTKTRGAAYPDNQFRNVLELHYNSAHDRTWLINELPIELYLRGIGETSNVSHPEFQKALLTVARTYAFTMYTHKTKHADEYFDISSYADDQVYDGYGQEARSPNLVQSVQNTAGVIVTYQGETAVTPYFSRSDGHTRSWSDVWYGDVPYLKSVSCPCDKGKTLWGHGVGMSASEALCQANQGKQWEEIINYFYTGVDLTKRWE